MKLSILDIQAPLHMPDVVAVAEEAGYHRYWVSEHHTPTQSGSPTLAAALAAGLSERLRVGMGGVLLRMHQPMRVAADVALLRTFFPGRVDVGVAGAGMGDALARALSGQALADEATYRARIEELVRLSCVDPNLACSAFSRRRPPEFWLCGTSQASAALAGALGLRYAYHHHLAPRGGAARATIGAAYRDAFRPGLSSTEPYLAIAAYGAVADDDARGLGEWRHYSGEQSIVAPSFVGDGARVAEQLQALAASYGADEVFIDCFGSSAERRLDGLRSVAEALGLADASARGDAATPHPAPHPTGDR